EVRTMAKDIAKVREKQSRQEGERIAGQKPEVILSQEPKKEPGAILNVHPEGFTKSPAGVKQLTPAPKKPGQTQKPLASPRSRTKFEKLFIRFLLTGIIIFLVFNAVAFGFWYLFQRESAETKEPAQEQQVTKEEPTPTPEPVPTSFFEAPQQELLLGNSRELLQELKTLLSSPLTLGFLNIVVKTQLGILSTKQFLLRSEITMPPALKEKLTESIMLFSYHADNKKRLGVIFELKETEGVTEQLQSWEQTLEQDTRGFFDIIDKKGTGYAATFSFSTYQGIPVRFQTFSVIDFGIVYGVINNKLLLTSSFESFQRAVDQLQTP
ncbi:MAG: hypothetical protein Q8P55_01250, partial [bacterium]|nr:hypothetical protein [bacterium]